MLAERPPDLSSQVRSGFWHPSGSASSAGSDALLTFPNRPFRLLVGGRRPRRQEGFADPA
jgi:hypothetical protein